MSMTLDQAEWERIWDEEKQKARPFEPGHKVWLRDNEELTPDRHYRPVLIREMMSEAATIEFADGSIETMSFDRLVKTRPY